MGQLQLSRDGHPLFVKVFPALCAVVLDQDNVNIHVRGLGTPVLDIGRQDQADCVLVFTETMVALVRTLAEMKRQGWYLRDLSLDIVWRKHMHSPDLRDWVTCTSRSLQRLDAKWGNEAPNHWYGDEAFCRGFD